MEALGDVSLDTPTKKGGSEEIPYTLALLDKYKLKAFYETLKPGDNATDGHLDDAADDCDDAAFEIVKPFLRQSSDLRGENVTITSGSTRRSDKDNYFVITNETKRQIPISERITNFFTDTPNRKTCESYSSSVILFPLEDEVNLALAYLFGKWVSLINRECIVVNFGVITLASEGMVHVGEGGLLSGIKSAETISTRGGVSTKNWSKHRANLGKLGDLKCMDGNSVLTELRAKTQCSKKLMKGKDVLKLHLQKLPTDSCEKPDYAQDILDQALYHYNIYKKGPVVNECVIYFDSPVSPEVSRELFKDLDENWAAFVRENRIIFHEVLWGMLYSCPHKDEEYVNETLSLVMAGKSGTVVEIGGHGTRIANLICVQSVYRDQPGTRKKLYYRMERGTWYEMHESKIEFMKAAILENHLIDSTYLNLSVAYEEQKEDVYNKTCVDEINALSTGKFTAQLFDKNLVHLDQANKFELADIYLKEKASNRAQCYLIHVKRDKSSNLDHLCNQVERSAHFMSHNLDRTPAAKSFAKSLQENVYEKYIDISSLKGKFSNFQKIKNFPKTHESLIDLLDSYITKGRKMADQVKEIKEVIGNWKEWDQWKETYEKLSSFDLALPRWVDCMVDYVFAPRDSSRKTADVMREILELMLEWLSNQEIFTKFPHGILLPKQKGSITFVLAIITDKTPENYLLYNKVIIIDNVVTAVQKLGFECKVTFIPLIPSLWNEQGMGKKILFEKTTQIKEVLLVKENSLNDVYFSRDLVTGKKTVGKAKKTVGKSAKKRTEPVQKRKRKGIPEDSLTSAKKPKAQQQAEKGAKAVKTMV